MSFGPLRAQDTRPALLIQVLGNTEELDWLGKEKHNYGHLLRVTIPRNPALLAVKATLKDLAAYSADFVPPEALDTLASYLLSWAATIAPFDMLTAEQLLMAAASDDGGLCGPCSHCMQKAPCLLSRRRRYPVVANPRAGWRPVVARSRRNWWSSLLPMLWVQAETCTSCP